MVNRLEIACFNEESALLASHSGADRIELCMEYASGGLTPFKDLFVRVSKVVSIPVFVMIRPVSGAFHYSEGEFTEMKQDISEFKALNAGGFVFGILNHGQDVDMNRNSELVSLAFPLPCTFHRAFDRIADQENALEQIIACGFRTVLTSGHAANARQGADRIRSLVGRAAGRITIMPGGGIRSDNVRKIMKLTGASWYHSSALTGESDTADAAEIRNLKKEIAPEHENS